MKKQLYFNISIVSLLLFTFLSVFIGCGGGGGTSINSPLNPNTTETLSPMTPEQLEQIELQVQPIADSSLFSISTDPNAFYIAANQIKTIKGVKAISIDESSLSVQYDFGGIHTWVNNPPVKTDGFVIVMRSIKNNLYAEDVVSNKKALIINSLYEDASESSTVIRELFHPEIERILKDSGYTVDNLNGSQVTVESFKNLYSYGLIVITAHGDSTGLFGSWSPTSWSTALTILQTGEVVKKNDDTFFSWITSDGARNFTVEMTLPWGKDGKEKKSFYAVTQRFFEHYYDGKRFPTNSIFYNGACKGMKRSLTGIPPMAKALTDLGVGVYLGWTDNNKLGPGTGLALLEEMTDGDTLANALTKLDPNLIVSRYNDNGKEIIAYLEYYPDNDITRNIQLNPSESTPVIQPSNQEKIYFVRSNDIYTINPDGTGETRLTNTGKFVSPVLSPDGKKIVFVSDAEEGINGTLLGKLGIANSDGSSIKIISNYNYWNFSGADWFPDSQTFRYEKDILDLNGTKVKEIPITGDLVSPSTKLSPDGTKIVYTTSSQSSGTITINNTVLVSSIDGTNTQSLLSYTTGPAESNFLLNAWAPNGKELAVSMYDSTKGPMLWYVNLENNTKKLLVNKAYVNAWTHDGEKIIYGGNRIINSDGTGDTQLVSGYYSCLSPDGKNMIYSSNGDLWIYNFDTQKSQKLTSSATALGWVKEVVSVVVTGQKI